MALCSLEIGKLGTKTFTYGRIWLTNLSFTRRLTGNYRNISTELKIFTSSLYIVSELAVKFDLTVLLCSKMNSNGTIDISFHIATFLDQKLPLGSTSKSSVNLSQKIWLSMVKWKIPTSSMPNKNLFLFLGRIHLNRVHKSITYV